MRVDRITQIALADGTLVDEDHPIPTIGGPVTISGNVTIVPFSSSFIDHSGTLTSSNVSQSVMAANSSRKQLTIQNNSAETVWINFGANAGFSQPSFKLISGAAFVMEGLAVSNESVSVIGATTGLTYTAKEI